MGVMILTRQTTRIVPAAAPFLSALVLCSCSDHRAPAEIEPPAARAQTVELAKTKQKRIWLAEHVTFKIEAYFGKPFSAALAERDAAQLQAFFNDDFAGQVFDAQWGDAQACSIVSQQQRDSGAQMRTATAEDVVNSLLAALAEFDEINSLRTRVLHIERTEGQPARWLTTLMIEARGRDSGPMEYRSRHQVEFALDEENIVPDESVVARWQFKSEILCRSPRPLMQEVTSEVGLDDLGLPDNWKMQQANKFHFQMAVEDFDRDGWLDIAIATADGRPYLLRSHEGRRFEDVAEQLGLHTWSPRRFVTALAGWIDYDNDGYPDLLVGNRLYHNDQGQGFTDVTAYSGLRIGLAPKGCTVADYDCDGYADLYLLYQSSPRRPSAGPEPWVGDNESGARNALWRNQGNGIFREVTKEANAGGGNRLSFAASWLFYDDDHFPDIYIANDFGNNVLLRNRGDGTFEDVSERAGVTGFSTSMGVASGDLDNDGNAEIYVANMYSKMGRRIIGQVCEADYPAGIFEQIQGSCAGNRLYTKTTGNGGFREVSNAMRVNGVGWAFAPAMTDLDGDGWLDLYATSGFMSFDRKKPDG